MSRTTGHLDPEDQLESPSLRQRLEDGATRESRVYNRTKTDDVRKPPSNSPTVKRQIYAAGGCYAMLEKGVANEPTLPHLPTTVVGFPMGKPAGGHGL